VRAGAAGALIVGIAAGLSAIGVEPASAAKGLRETGEYGQRVPEGVMLAVVSLADQRVTIYDAKGKLTEAPVSTGATGYETPAGIFSVVQKEEMHHSNLYDDAEMPFMQRITWTGIALHAGPLPGYPASHGCVRMPMGFAERLYGTTEMGMRVVIVPEDMKPSPISHPLLFKPRPVAADLIRLDAGAGGEAIVPGSARHLRLLRAAASAKAAEAEAAAKRLHETRATATRAASAAAAAARQLKAGEANLASAESALKRIGGQAEAAAATLAKLEAELATAEAAPPQPPSAKQAAALKRAEGAKQQAGAAKDKALAKVDELRAQVQALKAQVEAKRAAADRANAEAQAAAAAKDSAAGAAEDAALNVYPVSVFISRKTRRLYVRKGTHPVFEGPVTIGNPDTPIGTFVFTAVDRLGDAGEMRWSVVAMYKKTRTGIAPPAAPPAKRTGARPVSKVAAPSDTAAASAALDRIGIDKEALDIITKEVLPGSSLIVSDEGPSHETGKDTDFVVVMSDEPQGALKIREHPPSDRPDDLFAENDRPGRGSPFSSAPPFFWNW
jgi:hypothetical protein